MLTIAFAALWELVSPFEPAVNALVVLAILIFGVRFGFSILPPWVRNLVGDVLSFLYNALRYALGIGHKGGGKK